MTPHAFRAHCASVLAVLFFCSIPLALHAQSPPRTLLVSGVFDQTEKKQLEDQLIALGISNLIAEELFATGRYIPLEDNPEIRKRMQELVIAGWKEADTARLAQLEEKAGAFGSDAMAKGIIRNFTMKKDRFRAGPLSSSVVKIGFDIEVVVAEKGEAPRSATGCGHGVTRARGVLLQIRDDKIRFDQTTLGSAAQEAVREAVGKLFPESESK